MDTAKNNAIYETAFYLVRMGLADKAAYDRAQNHPMSMDQYFSLQYVSRGAGALVVDGKEHSLSAGDVIFVFREETFDIRFYDNDFARFYFTFDILSGKETIELPFDISNRIVSMDYPAAVLSRCIKISSEINSSEPFSPQIAQACFAQLLYECAQTLHKRDKSAFGTAVKKNIKRLTKARDFADSHFEEHITPEKLAQTAGLSMHYFENLFRQFTGFTVSDYVMRARIKAAHSLLIENRFPIKVIAEKCGFSDVHHFTKKFKHIMGVTPGAFLQQMSEM